WQSHRAGLEELSGVQVLAGTGVLLASAGLLALVQPRLAWGGGWIHTGGRLGDLAAVHLAALLNRPGATLVLALVLLVSFMGATRLSYVGLLGFLGWALQQTWHLLWPPAAAGGRVFS
ncbi:MAG: DNA translocase FtsK 4TM domain-containing protein, partial [Deltaproteobacteria bacterium]|nr:DNA translocase FtsK 4TM domain-containing protein [Deltaproteobacteria bacterium]